MDIQCMFDNVVDSLKLEDSSAIHIWLAVEPQGEFPPRGGNEPPSKD